MDTCIYFEMYCFKNVWQSEENLESVLIFSRVSSRDQIQVIRFSNKHLTSPVSLHPWCLLSFFEMCYFALLVGQFTNLHFFLKISYYYPGWFQTPMDMWASHLGIQNARTTGLCLQFVWLSSSFRDSYLIYYWSDVFHDCVWSLWPCIDVCIFEEGGNYCLWLLSNRLI